MKKGLIIGIVLAFFILGFISMQRAMPEHKEERIYNAVKVYMPYKLEKYIGGLSIVDIRDGHKEKPDAASVYHRLDELEKNWGAKHLRVVNNELYVMGENNQSITKIFIETQKEREWLKNFFGI